MTGIGYGADTSCGAGGYRSGVIVRGRKLLTEAIFRRLTTPRGTLNATPEEGAYGEDISALVGSVGGEIVERILPSRISAELAKDDRITSTDVTVTRSVQADEEHFLVEIDVTPADGSGVFPLTIAVDQVGAKLILGDTQGSSNG